MLLYRPLQKNCKKPSLPILHKESCQDYKTTCDLGPHKLDAMQEGEIIYVSFLLLQESKSQEDYLCLKTALR